jgi:hypothetical protein
VETNTKARFPEGGRSSPVSIVGTPVANLVSRALTCVRPFVNLEILAPGEDLAAVGKGAREGLLPRVHPDVVDQLVLGLEGASVPGAVLPEAGVRGALRPPDVLHGEVRDDLVHVVEVLAADLPGGRLLLVHPEALHLLLDGLAHVPEEGAVHVGRVVRHGHVVEVLVVVGLVVGVRVGAGVEHLVVRRQVVLVGDVAVVVEEHRLAGRRLRRRELVLAPEEEVARGVPGVVQVAHVAVVRLEVVVLRAHLGRRHRRRRVLVRRRDRGAAAVVPRAHLYPVRGQVVVVAGVHERVYHCRRNSLTSQKHTKHMVTLRNALSGMKTPLCRTTCTPGVHSWTDSGRAVGHAWGSKGRRTETRSHWLESEPLLLVPANNDPHWELPLVRTAPIAPGGGTR